MPTAAGQNGSRRDTVNPRSLPFEDFLAEEMRDPEFRKGFYKEHVHSGIAVHIALLREKRGLTQSALARKLGMSQQALSDIERQRHVNITLRTMQRLAEALDTDLAIEFKPRC